MAELPPTGISPEQLQLAQQQQQQIAAQNKLDTRSDPGMLVTPSIASLLMEQLNVPRTAYMGGYSENGYNPQQIIEFARAHNMPGYQMPGADPQASVGTMAGKVGDGGLTGGNGGMGIAPSQNPNSVYLSMYGSPAPYVGAGSSGSMVGDVGSMVGKTNSQIADYNITNPSNAIQKIQMPTTDQINFYANQSVPKLVTPKELSASTPVKVLDLNKAIDVYGGTIFDDNGKLSVAQKSIVSPSISKPTGWGISTPEKRSSILDDIWGRTNGFAQGLIPAVSAATNNAGGLFLFDGKSGGADYTPILAKVPDTVQMPAIKPSPKMENGISLYTPYGNYAQTEVPNVKLLIDKQTGELGAYQQVKDINIMNPDGSYGYRVPSLVSSAGRNALQSGAFTIYEPQTPFVASQEGSGKFALPSGYGLSRLGAEAYGGYVMPLDGRTIQSTGAQYSVYANPENLANLVNPQGPNLPKSQNPGAAIPWEIPYDSPTIGYMDNKGVVKSTNPLTQLGYTPSISKMADSQNMNVGGNNLTFGIIGKTGSNPDYMDYVPGSTKVTETKTPGDPSLSNFIPNFLGSVGNEGIGLVNMLSMGFLDIPKFKTDYGFGETTTKTERTYNVPGSDSTKTLYSTITNKDMSLYESMNKQMASAIPQISIVDQMKMEKDTSALGYARNLGVGFYDRFAERPLDMVKAADEIYLLGSASIGTAGALGSASKAVPYLFAGTWGVGSIRDTTKDLTDFSTGAAQRGGGHLADASVALLGIYGASKLPSALESIDTRMSTKMDNEEGTWGQQEVLKRSTKSTMSFKDQIDLQNEITANKGRSPSFDFYDAVKAESQKFSGGKTPAEVYRDLYVSKDLPQQIDLQRISNNPIASTYTHYADGTISALFDGSKLNTEQLDVIKGKGINLPSLRMDVNPEILPSLRIDTNPYKQYSPETVRTNPVWGKQIQIEKATSEYNPYKQYSPEIVRTNPVWGKQIEIEKTVGEYNPYKLITQTPNLGGNVLAVTSIGSLVSSTPLQIKTLSDTKQTQDQYQFVSPIETQTRVPTIIPYDIGQLTSTPKEFASSNQQNNRNIIGGVGSGNPLDLIIGGSIVTGGGIIGGGNGGGNGGGINNGGGKLPDLPGIPLLPPLPNFTGSNAFGNPKQTRYYRKQFNMGLDLAYESNQPRAPKIPTIKIPTFETPSFNKRRMHK